ncbi:MAG: hypothetical protein B6229_01270 [Spirochaetaceae bacterium 4572_7]|nr:MAG: hypothetical protein B6229_01270 [Spirochaetaceae bacterium 4572_7]
MQIYNITKERVTEVVNKAFESKDRPVDLCLCYQCRLDVTCYVLNRAKPIYVLSERGISHLKDNYSDSLQDLADLTRLVADGIHLVAKAKRKHHLEPLESKVDSAIAYFNFPTITGTLLAGETFAPIAGKVTLLIDNKIVPMKDSKWLNPIELTGGAGGHYVFWPKSIPTKNIDEKKTFQFQLEITSELYETKVHFFELTITSRKELNETFQAHNAYTCDNILLFKAE